MAKLRGQNEEQELPLRVSTKKPRRWQGRERGSGLQSGLGRGAQRSGDPLAQATAPTEGGCGAEQGQGAGDSSGGWIAKEQLDRLTGAGKGPSADQARCGEAEACQGLSIERGAADNWSR